MAVCYHDCKTAVNVVVLWYSAVSKIVKDDTKINKVCQALELPVGLITPAELQFLKDYCSVVKPVSTAIDILQGEKTVGLLKLCPANYQVADDQCSDNAHISCHASKECHTRWFAYHI